MAEIASPYFEDVPEAPEQQEFFDDASNEYRQLIAISFEDEQQEQAREAEKRKHTPHPPKPPTLIGDVEWYADAKCKPPKGEERPAEYYRAFDGEGTPGQEAWAKKLCLLCKVGAKCLTYALDNPLHTVGIWGGTTDRQRHGMKRRML